MQSLSPNSEEYWDMLFTKTWEERRGREQTAFFARVALDHSPDWLKQEIRSNCYRICDVGCALGDGVDVLANEFPTATITGIDFSQEAIKKASEYYPTHTFIAENILEMKATYDIVFSSNTLEHFHDPFPILRKLLQQSNKYVLLLLPFQDDTGTYEHFFRFDYEHFPEKINDFRLTFLKKIDCRLLPGTYWNADQVLVIYKKEKGTWYE